MSNGEYSYPRIPQDDYQKAGTQWSMQMTELLRVFDCYGLGVHIPEVVKKGLKITEQYGMRVRGKKNQMINWREQERYNADD